jgi:hypothetical protein
MTERLLAEMKASQEEMMAMMKAWQKETKACQEAMGACLRKTEARIETSQEPRDNESKSGLEEVKATESETNQKQIEAERETIRATED